MVDIYGEHIGQRNRKAAERGAAIKGVARASTAPDMVMIAAPILALIQPSPSFKQKGHVAFFFADHPLCQF